MSVFLGNSDGVEFCRAGKISACNGFLDEANRLLGNDGFLIVHRDVVVAVVEKYLADLFAAEVMFYVIGAANS